MKADSSDLRLDCISRCPKCGTSPGIEYASSRWAFSCGRCGIGIREAARLTEAISEWNGKVEKWEKEKSESNLKKYSQ